MEMWHNRACREPNKTIVCGHWHCSWGHVMYEDKGKYTEFDASANWEPFAADGILAIDACTAYTQKINCVIIEI